MWAKDQGESAPGPRRQHADRPAAGPVPDAHERQRERGRGPHQETHQRGRLHPVLRRGPQRRELASRSSRPTWPITARWPRSAAPSSSTATSAGSSHHGCDGSTSPRHAGDAPKRTSTSCVRSAMTWPHRCGPASTTSHRGPSASRSKLRRPKQHSSRCWATSGPTKPALPAQPRVGPLSCPGRRRATRTSQRDGRCRQGRLGSLAGRALAGTLGRCPGGRATRPAPRPRPKSAHSHHSARNIVGPVGHWRRSTPRWPTKPPIGRRRHRSKPTRPRARPNANESSVSARPTCATPPRTS